MICDPYDLHSAVPDARNEAAHEKRTGNFAVPTLSR